MKKCMFCGNCIDGKCVAVDGATPDRCVDYFINTDKVRGRFPLILSIPPEKSNWVRGISFDFKDTPKSLYRFLFLWEPKNMDFSDMYKCSLVKIDLNGTGIVVLKLYKFELAAYLYVPPSELKPRPHYAIEVTTAIPATEDEEFIQGSKAIEELEIFGSLLEQTHVVYSGNDFEV